MRTRIASVLATAVTAIGAQLVVAAPAHADVRLFCNYWGNFKSGTFIEYADWNSDGTPDECFGIAPDRTIWHSWPKSGGWFQMPNNGRADFVIGSFRGEVDGRGISYYNEVVVRVVGGADYYSWRWETSTSKWSVWTRCTATSCS